MAAGKKQTRWRKGQTKDFWGGVRQRLLCTFTALTVHRKITDSRRAVKVGGGVVVMPLNVASIHREVAEGDRAANLDGTNDKEGAIHLRVARHQKIRTTLSLSTVTTASPSTRSSMLFCAAMTMFSGHLAQALLHFRVVLPLHLAQVAQFAFFPPRMFKVWVPVVTPCPSVETMPPPRAAVQFQQEIA